MKLCDLHTHTVFSDGTLTPQQLVELAEKLGVGAVALTDHNSVSGLPAFLAAGEGSSVQTVPGIEFSTEYQGKELHIVMLFVKPADYDEITAWMEGIRARKEQSNRDLVAKLQEAGMQVDYKSLVAQSPDGYINRMHVAVALVQGGYVEAAQEIADGTVWNQHVRFMAKISGDFKCQDGGAEAFLKEKEAVLYISQDRYAQWEESLETHEILFEKGNYMLLK